MSLPVVDPYPFPGKPRADSRALLSLIMWALATEGDIRDPNATTVLRRRLERRGLETYRPTVLSRALVKSEEYGLLYTETRDGERSRGKRLAVIALTVDSIPPYPTLSHRTTEWAFEICLLNGEPEQPVVPMPEPPVHPSVPQPEPFEPEPEELTGSERLRIAREALELAQDMLRHVVTADRGAERHHAALEEAARLRRKLADAVESTQSERKRADGLTRQVRELRAELLGVQENLDRVLKSGVRLENEARRELETLMRQLPTARGD